MHTKLFVNLYVIVVIMCLDHLHVHSKSLYIHSYKHTYLHTYIYIYIYIHGIIQLISINYARVIYTLRRFALSLKRLVSSCSDVVEVSGRLMMMEAISKEAGLECVRNVQQLTIGQSMENICGIYGTECKIHICSIWKIHLWCQDFTKIGKHMEHLCKSPLGSSGKM